MVITYIRLIIQGFILATLFIYQSAAQLGTQINYPVSNDTITPGQNINIQYQYENMGNGTYTVDVNLWQDNAASILAKNIATNVSVPSGTSAGTGLAFYLNATYNWNDVPHGLNETVYLTMTTNAQLNYSGMDLSMRSRPILLHVNAGIINMSLSKLGLLAVSIGVLFFVGF